MINFFKIITFLEKCKLPKFTSVDRKFQTNQLPQKKQIVKGLFIKKASDPDCFKGTSTKSIRLNNPSVVQTIPEAKKKS